MVEIKEISREKTSASNKSFWNELCGTGLATGLGLDPDDEHGLREFDVAYFDLYPYLVDFVDDLCRPGQRVLEIGLGYGSLSERIAASGAQYVGLDIAAGPVKIVQRRLNEVSTSSVRSPSAAVQGSALDLPFPDGSFDRIVAIGSLHHTGDTELAIRECRRCLRPGGTFHMMVYNKHSFRQLVEAPARYAASRARHSVSKAEFVRGMYDSSLDSGEAAPHTDYFALSDLRRMLSDFEDRRYEIRNFDTYVCRLPRQRRVVLRRESFLGNVGRLFGLDIYVTATVPEAN